MWILVSLPFPSFRHINLNGVSPGCTSCPVQPLLCVFYNFHLNATKTSHRISRWPNTGSLRLFDWSTPPFPKLWREVPNFRPYDNFKTMYGMTTWMWQPHLLQDMKRRRQESDNDDGASEEMRYIKQSRKLNNSMNLTPAWGGIIYGNIEPFNLRRW